MTAIINWTVTEFVLAIPAAFALTIVSIGVATTLSEFFERRLRKWWTGEWPK